MDAHLMVSLPTLEEIRASIAANAHRMRDPKEGMIVRANWIPVSSGEGADERSQSLATAGAVA